MTNLVLILGLWVAELNWKFPEAGLTDTQNGRMFEFVVWSWGEPRGVVLEGSTTNVQFAVNRIWGEDMRFYKVVFVDAHGPRWPVYPPELVTSPKSRWLKPKPSKGA